MNSNPYKVQGTAPVHMFGRQNVYDALIRHLTKETPDHVSVIGAKYIGKSVLLRTMADHFARTNKRYIATIYWDLRHHTPAFDSDFQQRFASEIQKALQRVKPELSKEIDATAENPFEIIDIILGELDRDNLKILMVMDDFDRILAGASLTRNLWDSLRDLALHPALRLVTGSQRRLRELCKTDDSKTSDFWNIFYDSPVQITALTGDDIEYFLQPLYDRRITFDSAASKELVNWTGGVPALVSAVAARLFDHMPDSHAVSKAIIDDLAKSIPDECYDLLCELWDDCSFEQQTCLTDLGQRTIPAAEISRDILNSLVCRGYAAESAGTVKHRCRILKNFAARKAVGIESLNLLFGTRESFENNIRNLLEIRLQQTPVIDCELFSFVERAIRDVMPEPRLCINGIRGIAERALDVILQKEMPDNVIPEEWQQEWKFAEENISGDIGAGRIPRKRSGQCRLLNLMTGTMKARPVARHVTKPTFLLIDFLQSVGDFGQHIEHNPVTVHFAATVCMAAIDLCGNMARDFEEKKA
jgi:hypothetical protein